MSRLQQGGLALVINDKFQENVGIVVYLLGFIGHQECFDGSSYDDGWVVAGFNVKLKTLNSKSGEINLLDKAVTSAKNLMPLGDEKGVEMYKLREEDEVIA